MQRSKTRREHTNVTLARGCLLCIINLQKTASLTMPLAEGLEENSSEQSNAGKEVKEGSCLYVAVHMK